MPRKPAVKPVRRPCVPKTLKVTVQVQRGDLGLSADTTAPNALNTARFLTAIARTLAQEAPDVLPHVDCVPGNAIEFTWGDHEAEERKRLGF